MRTDHFQLQLTLVLRLIHIGYSTEIVKREQLWINLFLSEDASDF